MSKWAQRLALLEANAHHQATDETDKTDKTRVVSVLSVPEEGMRLDSQTDAPPSPTPGPVSAAVQQLGAEARELLDCMLWIHADTGALPEREIARALGWPLGAVFGAINRLEAVGALVRSGKGWWPSKRLQLELRPATRLQVG